MSSSSADAPTEKHELIIAALVAKHADWGLGRELGPPTDHDDGSLPGLVDIIFHEADPPVALEVTSIVDGEFVGTAAAASLVAERLDAFAQELAAGRWYFTVVSSTRMQSVEDPLRDIMAAGTAEHPALSDTDGLDDGLPAGVISVHLDESLPPGARIATWGTSGAVPLAGLTGDLHRAIGENVTKLGAVAGHERHLAVDVRTMRATDPSRTPAPRLPAEIDYLWVFRRHIGSGRSGPAVWLTAGSGAWRTRGDAWT